MQLLTSGMYKCICSVEIHVDVNVLHVVMKSKNEITDKSFKMDCCFCFLFLV